MASLRPLSSRNNLEVKTEMSMPEEKHINETKYLWVRPTSNFRHLWKPLTRCLCRVLKLKPLFLVGTEEDKRFYIGDGEYKLLEDEIVVLPSIYETAITDKEFNLSELINLANKYEVRFGISFLRDLLQSDRHLGKGMIWGWNGVPNSKAADRSTEAGKLAACIQSFEFFEDLMSNFPPNLAIGFGLGTGITGKPIPLLCKERQIPFRSISSSRIGGTYYWAEDEFNNSLAFERMIAESQNTFLEDNEVTLDSVEPSQIYTFFSAQGGNRHSLLRAVKLALKQVAMRTYHKIKGYRKSAFGYYVFSSAYSVIYQWWAYRQSRRHPFHDFDDLPADRKVVLFPLQYEFEVSLYGESPEANSLLVAIYETAISLPAGTILAVKEHPLQPGRRPALFYQYIIKLPNVVLIKPEVCNDDVFQRISAVVQINSSLGYEAISRGIPVFSFSRHGPINASFNNYPIRRSEDFKNLRDCLMAGGSEVSSARLKWATAYATAAKAFCFELPEMEKIMSGSVKEKDFQIAADHLIQSLSEIGNS